MTSEGDRTHALEFGADPSDGSLMLFEEFDYCRSSILRIIMLLAMRLKKEIVNKYLENALE